MGEILTIESAQGLVGQAWTFIQAQLLTWGMAVQIAVVAAALLLALLITPKLKGPLDRLLSRVRWFDADGDGDAAPLSILFPLLWLTFVWVSMTALQVNDQPWEFLRVVSSLLSAWVFIRFASKLLRDSIWSNVVFTVAWVIAALNILRLMEPTVAALDGLGLNLGDMRISALTVIKGMIALGILLWAASFLSGFIERRIKRIDQLEPSIKLLLSKLLQFVLITIAILAAFSVVGVDLTVFAVFGGALGVGIGLGMQQAASNVFGGLLLLMDKSIKPGDVIAIDDTYGWVTSLGGRYVGVRTRDGTEKLVPNEVFITNGVENWSHSDRAVRLRIPVGVAYGSDVRKALALCEEAALEEDRILRQPAPRCLMKEFGDSSLNLELRMWISDPQNGVSSIKSPVMLRILDKFEAEGIQIPFPQRDVHLLPSEEFSNTFARGGEVMSAAQ